MFNSDIILHIALITQQYNPGFIWGPMNACAQREYARYRKKILDKYDVYRSTHTHTHTHTQ